MGEEVELIVMPDEDTDPEMLESAAETVMEVLDEHELEARVLESDERPEEELAFAVELDEETTMEELAESVAEWLEEAGLEAEVRVEPLDEKDAAAEDDEDEDDYEEVDEDDA